MSYQYILFDLDGTILNSGNFLNNALEHALNAVGHGHLATPELKMRFLGVPLREGLVDYCYLSEEQSEQAVDAFMAFYLANAPGTLFPFDGIADMLKELHADGRKLAIATNGVGSNARRVLHGCGTDIYFHSISGLTSLGAAETKSSVIERILKEFDVQDRSQAVMVGDRFFDIAAAKECGIDAIGVLYGYGSEEELTAAGATHIARSPEHLSELLLAQ